MRGAIHFIYLVIILLLGLTLAFIILGPQLQVFANPLSTTPPPPSTGRPSKFNYSAVLLSKNPVDLSTYDSCEKLKNAIKYSVITGRPFKVAEIEYGSDLVSETGFPPIGNCPPETLQIRISEELNQTVCNFKTITSKKYDPDSLDPSNYFSGISDAAGLSLENCFYYVSDYSTIFGSSFNFIGPKDEDLNHPSNEVNLFYSPEYLYIRN